MSYLLFMDESGHDHGVVPYEVRGGISLHDSDLWQFVRSIQAAELANFGGHLHQFGSEIKGMKLLKNRVFKWANQGSPLEAEERRRLALAFLNKGAAQQTPTRPEFTGYGQACIAFMRDVLHLLHEHRGNIFATAIPRTVERPTTLETDEYLRKDHVFLFERYYYFLEREQETGLIVMDETERVEDRAFVSKMHRYFTKTLTGKQRTARIVPVPFFVSSDMAYPVQVADLCIYAINWGFRLPSVGMDADVRSEIAGAFESDIRSLQFSGDGYKSGQVYPMHGIVYIPDPYETRRGK
jgi:hypothetical protein